MPAGIQCLAPPGALATPERPCRWKPKLLLPAPSPPLGVGVGGVCAAIDQRSPSFEQPAERGDHGVDRLTRPLSINQDCGVGAQGTTKSSRVWGPDC